MKQADIDSLRAAPIPTQAHFISGFVVASRDGATLPTTSPIDGRKLTDIAEGGAAEIDLAVAAARRTYETGVWSRRSSAKKRCSPSPISWKKMRWNSPFWVRATMALRSACR
jgi:gamma-glutamyl-gamma-aminobutyraldehyde dehydrogenase